MTSKSTLLRSITRRAKRRALPSSAQHVRRSAAEHDREANGRASRLRDDRVGDNGRGGEHEQRGRDRVAGHAERSRSFGAHRKTNMAAAASAGKIHPAKTGSYAARVRVLAEQGNGADRRRSQPFPPVIRERTLDSLDSGTYVIHMSYPYNLGSRVVVGSAACANSAAGIIANLQAGKRWFVFGRQTCIFEQPLDLATLSISARNLRFEGAGPGLTKILKGYNGAQPLLSYTPISNGWRWTLSGIEFNGAKGQRTGASPLIRAGNVYLSYFENCVFRNSAGEGFVAQAGAAVLNFVNCYFDDNSENGFRTENMNQVSFLGGGGRNNGANAFVLYSPTTGISVQPPDPCAPVRYQKSRGIHYLEGMHFEGNAGRGVVIENASPVIVRNCRFVADNLDLSLGIANTAGIIENNRFEAGGAIVGASTYMLRNNYP